MAVVEKIEMAHTRQAASCLIRLLLRREIPPNMKPLALKVPKDLLRQCTRILLMLVDHVPFPMGAEAAIMVTVV